MATRRRRTAQEAQAEILDAAERRLAASGPAALRLQEIARDVGISHSAVLHHFGSREALVRAVVDRTMLHLEEDLVRLFTGPNAGTLDSGALMDRVFETLFDRGQARLMAWLLLAGYDPFGTPAARENWTKIAQATHALRPPTSRAHGPDGYEDTAFTVVLSSLALFGLALGGKPTFAMASLSGDDVDKRFRHWLGQLLVEHLER